MILNVVARGMAQSHSIEQIERELLQSRFEGTSPQTEAMLSTRARSRMLQADVAGMKDKRIKQAFLTGYKLGAEKHDGILTAVLTGSMLGIPLLFVLLARTFTG